MKIINDRFFSFDCEKLHMDVTTKFVWISRNKIVTLGDILLGE